MAYAHRPSWIAVIVLVAGATGAFADEKAKTVAWDGDALAGDPQEIFKQAAALQPPKDGQADILLVEQRLRLESDGRRTITRRMVFRPLSRAVAEYWGQVQVPYAPWYQARPEIRARVITDDGQAHLFDAKTIADSPLGGDDHRIYSDRRLLRAPLPAMEVGAVAETVYTIADDQPFFAAGTVSEFDIGASTPIRRWRLIVEHPADFPAVISVQGIELKEVKEQNGDTVRHTFAIDDLKEKKPPLPLLPPEAIREPRILVSGRSSWNDVAKAYATIVAGQIRDGDVAAKVKSLLDGGETREQAAAKLLAAIHREVRYTSLAFGESAIVPATCEKTLERRFGDCKDQSALLVAMLRAAGYEAHVALVHSGESSDVAADHPALNHFNHAIVCLAGNPPLWIDPTVTHSRVGEVPTQEQGKLSLVCANETTELVRIPKAPSSANRTLERIEMTLGDGEPGRGTRSWEYSGQKEREMRAGYAQMTRAQIDKQWSDYVEKGYDGAKIQELRLSDFDDLSGPFSLSVKFGPASSFQVNGDEWVIPIFPMDVLRDTPFWIYNDGASMRRALGDRFDDDAAERFGLDEPRKTDAVLPTPYVYDQEYRIVLPPGFVVRDLPEDSEVAMGPARCSWKSTQEKGAVLVAIHYDTGPGRFTPADLDASREGFKACDLTRGGNKWPLVVRLEHEGAVLLRNGKWQESLATYERHGQSVSVAGRCRYARALLAAGMGELARREARAVVEAHPQSAQAQAQLANILSANAIGQNYRPGCDIEGAIAAARAALALEADNVAYQLGLVELLQQSARHSLVDDDKRIAEAITLTEQILAKEATDPLALRKLMSLYIMADRFDDLREHLAKIPQARLTPTLNLAMTAATRGAAAAKALAARETNDEQRREQLYMAAGQLDEARRYDLAAELAEASCAGESPPQEGKQIYARAMRRMRRFEGPKFPESDPRSAVERLLALAWTRPVTHEEMERMTGTKIDDWDNALAKGQLDHIGAIRDHFSDTRTLRACRDRVTDAEFKVEGNDALGYRILVDSEFVKSRWFVAKTPEGYRLLVDGRAMPTYGRQALARLDAGDLAGAQQWLDWAKPDDERRGGFLFDPFSMPAPLRLWSLVDRDKPDDVRLAAHAFVCPAGRDIDASIAFLEKSRQGDVPPAKALQIDRALLTGYVASKRHVDSEKLCQQMLKRHQTPEILYAHIEALIGQKKHDEMRTFVKEFLEGGTTNADAPVVLAYALSRIGDFAAAADVYKQLGDSRKTPPHVYNNRAWLALFLPKIPDEALDDARKSCEERNGRDSAALHTLATLQAYTDQPQEAMKSLVQAVEVRRGRSLQHEDWLVIGRVAEAYGRTEFARACYEKVESAKEDSQDTSYELAQARLKELTGK
ncbi:MAG TPA: DUF3857 domain-containing protein [Pirellulaceae bacterium]|nr:DUF3857 domain-containing protein [Pirellulaceae bacterium]